MDGEAPSWGVDARGAKGLQIGDHNLQVNVYASAQPRAQSVYHQQIRAIAPDDLMGRQTELAEIESFCTASGPENYMWLRAAPWAGKTAILSWFALNPPPAIRVISFFITARYAAQSDREAFMSVVTEQLASALGEPIPAYITEATRASHLWELLDRTANLCEEQGERLVLIVDGLDEDTGAAEHSIAALLPATPTAGMRVIVSGRPDPPIPSDVPIGHPLHDRSVIRNLTASPHAQDIRREAERELKRILRGTSHEQGLVGLVTASGGGLSSRRPAELTGRQPWEIEDSLHAVAGRTFTRRPTTVGPEVYLLGHEELQSAATRYLGDTHLAEYRGRLHDWAEGYRRSGWPDGTPDYLLHGYFQMLHSNHDLDRMTSIALDSRRHDRVLTVNGGDSTSLAEITAAQKRSLS